METDDGVSYTNDILKPFSLLDISITWRELHNGTWNFAAHATIIFIINLAHIYTLHLCRDIWVKCVTVAAVT